MVESEVTVVNRLGLHARAAARLVRLTAEYKCSIKLHNPKTDRHADARSILDLLTLGASLGAKLVVSVDGDDEDKAIDAVVKLFADGFEEH
jgi:phosphocarrier protein NPr/phosphocarrier protein